MPPSTPSNSSITVTAPVVAAINHLLAQEAWARAALAAHAGKQACVDMGVLVLRVNVARDGMLAAVTTEQAAEQAADVMIALKLADLPLIVGAPERAFSYVKIAGDAEFANTLAQLGRGLRWEAEHDLEPLIGPIAATRLVAGVRDAIGTARTGARKLAENVAEFLLEEQVVLVRPAMVDDFGAEVSRLRDDAERCAKRVARLEQALGAPRGAAQPTLDMR